MAEPGSNIRYLQARRPGGGLKPPGGDGTYGDMEARVARLEAHMEHVRSGLDKLGGLPVQAAKLEERVAHLPTKGWMVGAMATGLAIIAALIAFGEKIQALVN
ncbi:hypothetical protein GG804_14020 [Sphingomonas histidinilytica]|uniref:hypothetical protein n=1 Tax=Rhizorhabdus histidinilytica TaxID=439228 RepID=UPI001ADC58F2|nr:hypothetical protein [Rhizorhabdus histidinilytica]MBO9377886.1 hypothetical protein [Rhizorhabdus histidinilytica]